MPQGRLRTTAPHLWPTVPAPYPSTTTPKPHTYKNRRAESVYRKQGFLALETDEEEEEEEEEPLEHESFQGDRPREETQGMMAPPLTPFITTTGETDDDKKPSIERRTRSSTASRAINGSNEPFSDVGHEAETATSISAVPSRKRSSPTVSKTLSQLKKQLKKDIGRRVANRVTATPKIKVEEKPKDAALGGSRTGNKVESSGLTRVTKISYDPNGLSRDEYVQGSRMVVKVQVDKPEYMDGSIADPNPALEEHVATVLGYFMNPFLHNLTFRKTDPMASEFYLKDHPIIYRFRQVPHGLGHTYQRTKGNKEECLMWEDTVIITPTLILEE